MGCKTILAAGAAVICTNGLYADMQVESTNQNVVKTLKVDQSAQKARLSRGGTAFNQSAGVGDRAGGDTPLSPTVVAALPFSDTGNNSLNTDAGDELCADTSTGGSGGLDQWYTYTSGSSTVTICISLCDPATDFDTKLYVYAGSITAGSPFACEDDTCSAGLGQPWVSELSAVAPPNTTFFCAVDAWTSANVGNFMGLAEVCVIEPCEVDCETTDIINPGICATGLDGDQGCFAANQDEFFGINCEETVCGTFFTDSVNGLRDLDFYTITLTESNDMTATLVSDGPSGYQLFFVDVTATGGCTASGLTVSFIASVGEGCATTGVVLTGAAPGEYWFFPAPFGTDSTLDCPNSADYRFAITCDCAPYLEGNVNDDTAVNFDDLNIVLGNWAATCGQ